jgi:hypothetical protein
VAPKLALPGSKSIFALDLACVKIEIVGTAAFDAPNPSRPASGGFGGLDCGAGLGEGRFFIPVYSATFWRVSETLAPTWREVFFFPTLRSMFASAKLALLSLP